MNNVISIQTMCTIQGKYPCCETCSMFTVKSFELSFAGSCSQKTIRSRSMNFESFQRISSFILESYTTCISFFGTLHPRSSNFSESLTWKIRSVENHRRRSWTSRRALSILDETGLQKCLQYMDTSCPSHCLFHSYNLKTHWDAFR